MIDSFIGETTFATCHGIPLVLFRGCVPGPCGLAASARLPFMMPSKTPQLEPVARAKHAVAPTVVDVARVADVALGTVSRVLNTPDAVRPDIRQRVLDAIASTGYRRLRQRRAAVGADGRRRRRGNFGILLIGMDES